MYLIILQNFTKILSILIISGIISSNFSKFYFQSQVKFSQSKKPFLEAASTLKHVKLIPLAAAKSLEDLTKAFPVVILLSIFKLTFLLFNSYSIPFHSCSILFHSYSILFYSILFYSIPFLFYNILFFSILFYFILFYSIPFLFYSILFFSIL